MSTPNGRRVAALKALLLEELERGLREGVTTTDDDGNVVRVTPDEKFLKLCLDTVKTFHAEIPPEVEKQGEVSTLLARYKERVEGRADA